VVELAKKQVLTTRLPGAVRETNRPRQVDDRVHFPSGRILRLFRLRFLGETKGGVEVAPLEGRFRLVHFRRGHVTGTKGAVHLRLPHTPSREPSCSVIPSAAGRKPRTRST